MLASKMIEKLQTLIEEYGDRDVWHEDDECHGYSLSDIVYDKNDDDFRTT